MESVLLDYRAVHPENTSTFVPEPAGRIGILPFAPLVAGAALAVALIAISKYPRPAPAGSPAPPAVTARTAHPPTVSVPLLPVPRPPVIPNAQTVSLNAQAVSHTDLMEVRFAAHRACECLARPLEVTRNAGKIVVEGVVSDFRRREAVVEALRRIPNIEMRIRTYEETAESRFFPCGPRAGVLAEGLKGAALTGQISAWLAGPGNDGASQLSVASDALTVSRTAADEAQALSGLMKSYPPETVAGMDARSRERLQLIAGDYVDALADRILLWRALVGDVPGSNTPGAALPAADLRTELTQLCESVQRADELTRRLLAAERPPPEVIAAARTELGAAVAQLEAGIAAVRAAKTFLP
jgi:hypothetical protein